jgi:hypothetical protein
MVTARESRLWYLMYSGTEYGTYVQFMNDDLNK